MERSRPATDGDRVSGADEVGYGRFQFRDALTLDELARTQDAHDRLDIFLADIRPRERDHLAPR